MTWTTIINRENDSKTCESREQVWLTGLLHCPNFWKGSSLLPYNCTSFYFLVLKIATFLIDSRDRVKIHNLKKSFFFSLLSSKLNPSISTRFSNHIERTNIKPSPIKWKTRFPLKWFCHGNSRFAFITFSDGCKMQILAAKSSKFIILMQRLSCPVEFRCNPFALPTQADPNRMHKTLK